MKIVLIGFACSYKTSVGKLLAEKLNYKHVDTDVEVEQLAGKSIAEIFELQSELEFRRLESWILLRTSYLDDAVISCGGGAPLHSAFDKLSAGATMVWLTSSANTVKQRLGQTARPLFDGKTVDDIAAIMDVRAPYYAKYADITVSTDGLTSQQVADAVYSQLIQINNTIK